MLYKCNKCGFEKEYDFVPDCCENCGLIGTMVPFDEDEAPDSDENNLFDSDDTIGY